MQMSKIICDECGKEIKPGNTNGMPNGVGFELEDGKIISICQSCLIEMGKKAKKEGDAT